MLQQEKQIMQSGAEGQVYPPPKRTHFLSEYESHDSESASSKIKHIRSSKFMRRLRELWNKQRYLTDDQLDSSKDQRGPPFDDSSMEPEIHSSARPYPQQPSLPLQPEDSSQDRSKRNRRRQVSSSDENLNRIRKSTELQEKPPIEADSLLSQIEAFNSEIENELSN